MSPLRALAASAALLLAATRAYAPPLPPPAAAAIPWLDRYLPDDTHGVLVYNVKPITSSPLYKKHFNKPADALLRSEDVAAFCKAARLNPLTDVHHVAYVTDPRFSALNAYATGLGGYLVILGRFDVAKLHQALRALAKRGLLELNAQGADAVYRSRLPALLRSHIAVIDRSAVVIASDLDQIAAVRAKRKAGQSAFKHRDLPDLLKLLRGNVAACGVGTDAMALGVRAEAEGQPGGAILTFKTTTLRDRGLRSLVARADLGDTLKGTVTLTGRDRATFADSARAVSKEVAAWAEELANSAPRDRIGPPAVMASLLKVARPRPAGLQLTYDAAVGGPAVKEMIDGFLEQFNLPSAFSPSY